MQSPVCYNYENELKVVVMADSAKEMIAVRKKIPKILEGCAK